jgi:hypothetical protein
MRNAADKGCRENHNTNYKFNNIFPPKSCHQRDDVKNYGRTSKATNDNKLKHSKDARMKTHTQHLTFIAFPWQQ